MMKLIPSSIQIGDVYYATIKRRGLEDVLKDRNGKKIPFSTGREAVKAAIKRIEEEIAPPSRPIEVKQPEEDAIVVSWREERLRQSEKDRAMANLLGIEVVTIKRRKIVGNAKAGGEI